jgi:hypothetical protein
LTKSSVSRRGLPAKAVALAAFLALATLGLVGCGSSSAPAGSVADDPSPTSPLSDEAAVRAFQAATERYHDDRWLAIGFTTRGRISHQAVLADPRDCDAQPPPSVKSTGKVAEIGILFDALLKAQRAVPAYEELAERLNAIPTENEALKTVASAVNQMSRDLGPAFRKADIDLCAELRRWEAADWSDSYYRELKDNLLSNYGLDQAKYTAAWEQLASTRADLEKIPGVSGEEALGIGAPLD